ncbi:MAG: hypothetical protein FWB71_03765 [Defluviitaleaceae bacterium]|nr:hypothetical protein [Defluviitaleaceae bacterium]
MAIETRVAQKEKLYALLVVQKALDDKGIQEKELERQIGTAIAPMEAEDVAYVKEQAAKAVI